MWPLKAHYVLWFGSLSGVLPYVSVYAKTHLGVSASAVGILYCAVPFVVSIGKPLACSIADHHGQHSRTLLSAQFFTLFSYGSLIFIPFLRDYLDTSLLWFLFCALAFVANVAMGVGTSLTDFLVINEVNLINQNGGDTNYGSFRIWGTVGFGVFGILSGIINETSKHLPYLLPGLCLYIAIECMDITYVYYFFHKPRKDFLKSCQTPVSAELTQNGETKRFNYEAIEPTFSDTANNKSRSLSQIVRGFFNGISNISLVLKQVYRLYWEYPSLLQHTFIVFCFGILTAFHWSFFFWFLEDIRGKDGILMGLCILVNSFVGEIPVFMVAHKFIQWIGPIFSFCVALAAFALRFFAYGYWLKVEIPGPYWDILLIESLQGLTFSLFYTVMTDVAQTYANKCDQLFNNSAIAETVADHESAKNSRPQYSLANSRASSIDDEAEGEYESEQTGHMKLNSLRSQSRLEAEPKTPPKPSATMQGLLSACYEGLGLGVGSLVGGQLIDQISKFAIWRFAAILSVALIVFNVLIEAIKFFCRRRRHNSRANSIVA